MISTNRTLKSPQILELSGIGDPEILAKINVETKVNLPAVGTNVQDRLFLGLAYGEYIGLCAGMRVVLNSSHQS